VQRTGIKGTLKNGAWLHSYFSWLAHRLLGQPLKELKINIKKFMKIVLVKNKEF
jgi:hypothetical protein